MCFCIGKNKHISFVQGDVGKLPMENETFDMVLSMNGFHTFPDKDKAFQETWRVLKKGWFTPPLHTENELKIILEKFYKNIDMHVDGSIVYFKCFNKLDTAN